MPAFEGGRVGGALPAAGLRAAGHAVLLLLCLLRVLLVVEELLCHGHLGCCGRALVRNGLCRQGHGGR